ncbi:hypothetical protein ACLESO_51685 [Pyxidicoccus sp. 3LG]
MSPLTLPTKLRSWFSSSPRAVPLLLSVAWWGLGAPRPRGLRALAFSPMLPGLISLGVLGWRAARAHGSAPVRAPAPCPPQGAFFFTWQISEELIASAASGH